ncbi:MAG: response regulator [bacterium]
MKKRKTIFIIDDESLVVEKLEYMLNDEGYDLLTAYNGDEAVNIFEKYNDKVDLVLLDIKLPKMSGAEVYNNFVKINPQIPVVIITGSFAKKEANKILKAGGKAVLYKPFVVEELLSIIKKYISR